LTEYTTLFSEQVTCLAGTTNDENGSAASGLSVIPYKGKLCKDLMCLRDPYRMTDEFDEACHAIYTSVFMNGYTHNDENDSVASGLSVILTRTSPVRIFWGQQILTG
jgi:hypothetical protein